MHVDSVSPSANVGPNARLLDILKSIHSRREQYGKHGDWVDYVRGAYTAGFVEVANAMPAYGAV